MKSKMKTYNLSDFQPGDLLIITSRSKAGEERRAAIVTIVNYNNGLVTFAGRSAPGLLPTGEGAFDPAKVGTTPYGLTVAVEKVGHHSDERTVATFYLGKERHD